MDKPWTPAELFKDGTNGQWLDYTDWRTCWQDREGTIPALRPGDPIRRVNDKSGNGNDWICGEDEEPLRVCEYDE